MTMTEERRGVDRDAPGRPTAGPSLDFDDFYAATWPRLLRTAYVVAGDRQLAEDAVQTAFARAYASWWRVTRADDPLAYVRRIAVNAALQHHRRPASRRERPVAEPRPPDATIPDDDRDGRDELWTAVRSLPPRQRAVVVLRFYEDLSEREIAAALGIRPGTVKSQCSAALTTLRGRLATLPTSEEGTR